MRTRYTHFKTVLEVDRMVSTQERPFPSASCSEVILKVYPGIYFSFVCLFLGPRLQHMEIPRPGVESELQPLACATATAILDLSCFCDLQHSSLKCRILNPMSEPRDWSLILLDTSRVLNLLSHNANSYLITDKYWDKRLAEIGNLIWHMQRGWQYVVFYK